MTNAALRSVLDEVDIALAMLDDRDGEALRVYARMLDGDLQCALATRDSSGALRLAAWQTHSSDPWLTWTARPEANGWVLVGTELR